MNIAWKSAPSFLVQVGFTLTLCSTLQAQYCIQVQTYDQFDARSIDNKTRAILETYESARIEKRGNHLTLRVGQFPSYRDALLTLERLHQTHRDAFVRKCDVDPAHIIHPIGASTPTPEASPTHYPPATVAHPKAPAPQPKRDERTLWEDCQKCFAPLYVEQEETPQITEPSDIKPTVASSRPALSSALKPPNDDAFWSEVIGQHSSASTSSAPVKIEYPAVEYYYPSQSK